MCGIVGTLSAKNPISLASLANMRDRFKHRGPDAEGEWLDSKAGIALGHRRLSILDLSATGAQPMHSACGRYVIVFNGEIYNFKKLRDEITCLHSSHVWRATCNCGCKCNRELLVS